MRFALITGGLGFIGSFIARQLLEEGWADKIVCLDHFGRYTNSLDPDFIDNRRLRFDGIRDRVIVERGEAKHYTVLMDVVQRYHPELVFHLAALPLAGLDNMNTEEAREGCIDSTTNLLEILSLLKRRQNYAPKRFVYCSSSMVYGDFESPIAREDHPTRPRNVYGTVKLAGEVVALGLGRVFDIPVSVIRPSAAYGPTDMNGRVSQLFIQSAMRKRPLHIKGRDVSLDFTYVRDLANGFVLAATQPNAVGQIFNITYGKAHSLIEFAEALKRHFPNLQYHVEERDQSIPTRGTLAIDKARELLGFEPQYTLQKGIAEYVEFVRKHEPSIA